MPANSPIPSQTHVLKLHQFRPATMALLSPKLSPIAPREFFALDTGKTRILCSRHKWRGAGTSGMQRY
jgi:hypothetical protein